MNDLDVYKIFTQHKPLTQLDVEDLFEYHSEFTVVDWLAYPEYDKIPNDVKVSKYNRVGESVPFRDGKKTKL